MKRWMIIVFSIVLSAQAMFSQQAWNTRLQNLDGKPVFLSEEKGKRLTVLDFWATWCKPCLISIPELIKLSKEFGEGEIHFIGINEDSPRNISKVKPFALSKGITYPVLLDTSQELMSALMVSVLPTLIVLDSKGRVLYTHEGFSHGDENEIKAKLSSLLSEVD